jgi:hypothetical protein
VPLLVPSQPRGTENIPTPCVLRTTTSSASHAKSAVHSNTPADVSLPLTPQRIESQSVRGEHARRCQLLPAASAPLLTPGPPEPPRTPQPELTSAEHAALAAAAAAAGEDLSSSMQFAVPVRVVPWSELAIQKPLGKGAYGACYVSVLCVLLSCGVSNASAGGALE